MKNKKNNGLVLSIALIGVTSIMLVASIIIILNNINKSDTNTSSQKQGEQIEDSVKVDDVSATTEIKQVEKPVTDKGFVVNSSRYLKDISDSLATIGEIVTNNGGVYYSDDEISNLCCYSVIIESSWKEIEKLEAKTDYEIKLKDKLMKIKRYHLDAMSMLMAGVGNRDTSYFKTATTYLNEADELMNEITRDINGGTNERINDLLFESVKNKDVSAIDNYIQQGADINYINKVSKITPLMMACILGDEDLIKFLIDNGADVNKRTDLGGTAIFYCGRRENILNILKSYGADMNIKDNKGNTYINSVKLWDEH